MKLLLLASLLVGCQTTQELDDVDCSLKAICQISETECHYDCIEVIVCDVPD